MRREVLCETFICITAGLRSFFLVKKKTTDCVKPIYYFSMLSNSVCSRPVSLNSKLGNKQNKYSRAITTLTPHAVPRHHTRPVYNLNRHRRRHRPNRLFRSVKRAGGVRSFRWSFKSTIFECCGQRIVSMS